MLSMSFRSFLSASKLRFRELDPRFLTSSSSSSSSSSSVAALPKATNASFARNVSICVGNEAGDADSIISAICYAYLVSKFKNESISSITTFPFVQVDKKQVKLLGDVGNLFNERNLQVDDLMCISDSLSFETGDILNNSNIILMDHNEVSSKVRALYAKVQVSPMDKVVEILDHHLDQGQHISSCPLEKRLIAFDSSMNKALVGSTCTLVCEYYVQYLMPRDIPLDEDVAHLLLGVILLDTYNMDEKAQRGTPRDLDAINLLMSICKYDQSKRDILFASLRDAKMSPEFWFRLQADEALSMDYKDFDIPSKLFKFGSSAVCMPLSLFLQKTKCVDAIFEYCKSSETNRVAMIVMCLFKDEKSGEFCRELLVSSKNATVFDTLVSQLMANTSLDLQVISKGELGEVDWIISECDFKIACFKQGNFTMSRKQASPIIQNILKCI